MKVAVVDIGTLKVKTLIAEVGSSGNLTEIHSSNVLTCFGCELDNNKGYILEKNLVSTINELKRVGQILKQQLIKKYRVVSTHAMRRAKNKGEVLTRIYKETGFEVENISQKQEAQLFFQAVMRDLPAGGGDYAVLDVGGGSVQVLVGNNRKLKKIHMMQSGAQFLHDNFTKGPNSPESFTTFADIERMKEHILKETINLQGAKETPVVYGSSNIIDLMQAIKIPLEKNEDSPRHPYKTYARHLDEFIAKVLPLKYEERERLFSFQKGYMWGVDKAFLNVTLIAERFSSPCIIPSNENIAKGIIYSLI